MKIRVLKRETLCKLKMGGIGVLTDLPKRVIKYWFKTHNSKALKFLAAREALPSGRTCGNALAIAVQSHIVRA
jgi:hypothetical protein